MLRHVAMFKFKEGATQAQKDAARDALLALEGPVPTLLKMTAGHNVRGARQSSRPWDDRLVDDRRLPAAFPPPLERRRHAA